MKNLLYNQIISLVITMIIILNYKFSFFDDLFEKYLFIGLIIGLVYSFFTILKIVQKKSNL
jgi:hypothetical protein